MKRTTSDGAAAERAAEYWFRRHGWTMFRTQPATRVVYVKGQPTTINVGTGGIPDYTGFDAAPGLSYIAGRYCACEIKDCPHGDTIPHSRLDKEQRKWMDALVPYMKNTGIKLAVGILWGDGSFEVFGYDSGRGSYVKGRGAR